MFQDSLLKEKCVPTFILQKKNPLFCVHLVLMLFRFCFVSLWFFHSVFHTVFFRPEAEVGSSGCNAGHTVINSLPWKKARRIGAPIVSGSMRPLLYPPRIASQSPLLLVTNPCRCVTSVTPPICVTPQMCHPSDLLPPHQCHSPSDLSPPPWTSPPSGVSPPWDVTPPAVHGDSGAVI